MTGAVFRILGEDATSIAFRSIIGSSEKSAKALEKIFRGAFGNIGGMAGGVGKHLGAIRGLLGVGGIAGAIGIATVAFTSLYKKVKETRDEHERVNDLAERLDLPSAKVRQYSEAWTKVATSLNDAARGFSELGKEQSRAFEALELDSRLSGSIDRALTRIAAASGEKSEKIDILRILTGLSYEEAEKALDGEIDRLNEKVRQRSKNSVFRTRADIEGVQFGQEDIGALRRSGQILAPVELKQMEEFEEGIRDIEQASLKLRESARKNSLNAMTAMEKDAADKRQEIYAAERAEFLSIQEWMGDSLEDAIDETNSRIEQSFGVTMDNILATTEDMLKPVEKEFSVFADEAARNMQDAFAQFLFDPFKDGLKGMLKGFIDTIRRMVAEVAAAKLFGNLGGTSGVGGFFSNLLGFANGGSFRVGGSGGTDSQMVAFKATPGEMVDVRKPGRSGGGATVVQHISIDARGSSVESVKLMQATVPAIIRQAVQQARIAVMDDISRGVRA